MVNLWDHFCEYADGCTIHGIKYLAEGKRHWYEKFFWIVAFVISITCCSKLILDIWEKWENFPVIVSMDDRPTPIFNLPFPAVTICPQTKTNSRHLNFTAAFYKYKNETDFNFSGYKLKRFNEFQAIIQLCEEPFDWFNFGEQTIGIDIVKHLHRLSDLPKFDMTWQNETMPYQTILTDLGLCYTFNMLNPEEIFRKNVTRKDYEYMSNSDKAIAKSTGWTLENGYNKETIIELDNITDYPYRVFTAHKKDALRIMAHELETNLDYICNPIQGYKILFHTPNDIPRFHRNFLYVPFDQDVNFIITPMVSKTSDILKSLSPEKRNCYYNDEKYLQFFQEYSQQNCELECLANFTLERCGCVKFSMPSIPGTPICGTKSIKCYLEVEYSNIIEQRVLAEEEQPNCNCIPSCKSIDYDVKEFNFNIDTKKYAKNNMIVDEETLKVLKLSKITITYGETEFFPSKRSKIYGFSDFVANCGGLIGLFMGISILSIMEISYFFSIRLICNEELTEKEEELEKEDPETVKAEKLLPELNDDQEMLPIESEEINIES